VDGSGNAYLFGKQGIYNPGGDEEDYATIKYNSDGNQLWLARYNVPLIAHSEPAAKAVDPSGNVHVTGDRNRSTSGCDYVTVKYNSGGTQLWAAHYTGPLRKIDRATALALDAQGNVFVTGISDFSGTDGSGVYATVKYDANGNQLWVARSQQAQTDGLGPALAVDDSGNIYVTGTSGRPLDASTTDILTLKYDATGTELWAATYDGPARSADFGLALSLDKAGNVYVTGSSYGATGQIDYATVSYGPDGSQRWSDRYNHSGPHDDQVRTLAVDTSGNVYVTGTANDPPSDYFGTVKYDQNGTQLWAVRDGDPDYANNGALALALDNSGNVYATGYGSRYFGSLTEEAGVTIKYDPGGNQKWLASYGGVANYGLGQTGNGLALDKSGNVFVIASTVLLKYVQGSKPLLTAPTLLLNGQYQFTLIGAAGYNYEIQSSPDLGSWTTFTNFLSATGTNLISDAESSSQRFYRAIQQP
jgi:hypothetical protein